MSINVMHAKPPNTRVLKFRSPRRLGDHCRYLTRCCENTRMNLAEAKLRYLAAGEFFDPDCCRDNETLSSFHSASSTLSPEQTNELVGILNSTNSDWNPKFFVADLLYYYKEIDRSLMKPMLAAATNLLDPSFNRIFLKPCVQAFGGDDVVGELCEKFHVSNLGERIGISLLVYWLRAYEIDVHRLCSVLETATNNTDNLIELYHYRLAMPNRTDLFPNVPDHAAALCQQIAGNAEYERLLYDELEWRRNS